MHKINLVHELHLLLDSFLHQGIQKYHCATALNKLQMCCEEAANPIDDKRGTSEFRRKVAGVLAKRAAQKAYDRLVGNT